MQKTCRKCSLQFEIAPEDEAFYSKIGVPAPTLCPDHRMQRRLSWRNDNTLFKRKCDFSDEELISMFSADSPYKVYHKDIWWSDKWDAKDYGRDFDFNRPFFEQFHELSLQVPYPHIITANSENSLYTNYNTDNRNCYMCFAGNFLEDSFYCYNAQNSRDCGDNLFIYDSELCYESIHSENCYNANFALHCKNSSDSWFIEDCIGVKNCFMCFNLRNKEYCIMNKQYSREEYLQKLSEYKLNTSEGLNKAYEYWLQIRKNFPKPALHNISVEDCSGEYMIQSQNCHNCYIMAKGCRDCRYIYNGFPRLTDAFDCCFVGEDSSVMYECLASGASCQNLFFCNLVFTGCYDVYYSSFLTNSKNCFGSVGMKNAQYCILNKQYSKEEYEELVPKIIEHMRKTGEWGEFFPMEMSPFSYENSHAVQFFPTP